MGKNQDSVAMLKRNETARFGLTIARSAIFAAAAAVVSVLAALISRLGIFGFLPSALGEGPFGTCAFCVLIFTVGCGVWLLAKPAAAVLDTLKNNTLNLCYKLGARPDRLATARPVVVIGGVLRIYCAAFALSAAAGLLFGTDDFASIAHILLLFAVGLGCVLFVLSTCLLAGTLAPRPLSVRIIAAAAAAVALALAVVSGFVGARDGEELALGLVSFAWPWCAAVFLPMIIGCCAACVLTAKKRLVEYNELELDYGDLAALGLTGDMELYEREGEGLSILVSGAQLGGHGAGFTADVPTEDEPAREKPTRSEKKRGEGKESKKKASKSTTGKKSSAKGEGKKKTKKK